MAKHIAHLFIRDPFVLKPETLDQDPSSSSDHFEVSPVHLPPLRNYNEDVIPFRLANPRIGKLSDSNLRRSIRLLAGELNSAVWKFN